jgi:tetratricopeptide (TPR) repeat protein
MEARYISEGSRCGACGSDLGTHEVWSLVFSDDEPEVVQRVLSGEINWVKCPVCGFDGAWLWPAVFIYVSVPEERAACVTPVHGATQQIGFLRQAFENDAIGQHGLDPERLLSRTKIVYDYRHISKALEIPVEQVELENAAILRYLERRNLTGRARIEHLIQSSLDSGVISLEAEEYTPEFLDELEEYKKTLTGEEDFRVPQLLDQVTEQLANEVVRTRKRLPRRDEMTALAQVFQTAAEKPKDCLKFTFDHRLEEAKADVLQLRLLRLCRLQLEGQLTERAAAPIDLRPELQTLIDQLTMGEGLEQTILTASDRRVLPEVKSFIMALPAEISKQGLKEPQGSATSLPAPAWLDQGYEMLQELYRATETADDSFDIYERLQESPLAQAFVGVEVGEHLRNRGELSGAMLNLSRALKIIQPAYQNSGTAEDQWIGRLYGICLERIGRLQTQYGRLEDAIQAFQLARSVYEQIGVRDGVGTTLRDEAAIWGDLNQHERAEQMYQLVIRESEGDGRADEVRDLLNLANVYRRLPPWFRAELKYVTKTNDAQSDAQSGEETEQTFPEPEEISGYDRSEFERKAGVTVLISVEGHDELTFQDLLMNESLRLLYRALAVTILNGDAEFERTVIGRLIGVYGETGCTTIANAIFDRMMENTPLEKAGFDSQLFALNRLRALAVSHEDAGNHELVKSTRHEELELLDFIMSQEEKLPPLNQAELGGEKACLLEGLDRLEEARVQYRQAIDRLERSRFWMRNPDNKRGLQSRRWRPYVRAARNALRIYAGDPSRDEVLIEAWYYIQEGRSRAMLDIIAADEPDQVDTSGVASVRPLEFSEVSARLPKDLALLEYVLMPGSPGCPGSWALFVVEPNADKPWLAWQEPDLERVWEAQQKLAAVANEFETTIVHYGFQAVANTSDSSYTSALEELADVLLPQGLLEKLRAAGYQRLVLVADAYLQEVPFAALRPQENGSRSYFGLQNEKSGFQLIYAPSASIFAHWTRRVPLATVTESHRAALFIDPLSDLSEYNAAVAQTFSAIESYLEARQIKVKRWDGSEATPEAWLTETPACNLVIYFGHSIAGPEETEPALMLNDGAGVPALITADTIYSTATRDLFAESSLFIFGSCSSGFASAGMWDSDRELRGLSVAHLYAGCGAVIAASRPLLDAPTLVLLNVLVTEILAGADAATCLTQAQKKMAASASIYAHPHFWGYVGLMGAPDWRLAEIN